MLWTEQKGSDVFNISNCTREHNPCVRTRRTAISGFDTWTMLTTYSRTSTSGVRFGIFLTVGAGFLADSLTSFPRRISDRLFAINDAEAGWRRWQVTEALGGLGRQYRDARWDALAADPALRCDDLGGGTGPAKTVRPVDGWDDVHGWPWDGEG